MNKQSDRTTAILMLGCGIVYILTIFFTTLQCFNLKTAVAVSLVHAVVCTISILVLHYLVKLIIWIIKLISKKIHNN